MEISKRSQEYSVLRKNYGKTSDEAIKQLLQKVKPLLKAGSGKLYELDEETREKVFSNPRGYSFTHDNKLGSEIKDPLKHFIQIEILVESASPWTLQPDVGEVFDQMTEDELVQTKAFWLDIRADEEDSHSSGVYTCTLYK
jgi:hypothetical protein